MSDRPPTSALFSTNPLRWLTVFGPGAIIASLTIGTGELVFSSRAGAIFGYSILWVFVVVSLLKWALVFSTARHMVLSGAHPLERALRLPFPLGWVFFILLFVPALVCFPVWVGFHSGVIGTFISNLSDGAVNSNIGGAIVLALILVLVFAGGYRHLERVQVAIVALMLASVAVSVVLMMPDWLDVLSGLLLPGALEYPDWLAAERPDLAARPVWIEASTYVGVIGGASYDYLAYVSFLREKHWGNSSIAAPLSSEALDAVAADPRHDARRWIRAPLVDCTLSFVIVIAFSVVFVVSGTMVLGPEKQIPSGENLLNLQAEFVTRLHPWLYPLYVAGAFLTMAGTLYGTIEVAPAIARELARCLRSGSHGEDARFDRRLRKLTVGWCALGACGVLAWRYFGADGSGNPRALVDIITPMALFTGVFSCGFICFYSPWADRRFLPRPLRMGWALVMLNLVAGAVFILVGARSYWEYFKDLAK